MRYLLAGNSALSHVSRLALLGLTLSVLVLVVVLSVVNGFERELRDRVLAVLPHITLIAEAGIETEALPGEDVDPASSGLVALAPFVSGNVLLAANDEIAGVNLTGVQADSYDRVTDVSRFTVSGSLAPLTQTRYGIVLGRQVAQQLAVGVGDKVLVVLPVGAITPAGAIPRQRRFEVVDLLISESQLDGQAAFTSLEAARRLFRTGNRVHGLQGRLVDLFQAQQARDYLYDLYPTRPVRVASWKSSYGNLYQAIAVQKLTMFVLLSFLVAVAAFNLVSGLIMIVEQRTADIAVLRTLGADSGLIMALFCIIGLLLSAFGIFAGLLLGVVLAQALPSFYGWLSATLELELMSQYFIAYLPVDVRWPDLLQIGGGALVMTLLASLFPAWRAAKLMPSRVLAQE